MRPSAITLFGESPCENVTAPVALSFMTASMSIFLTITTIIGNALVILAVFLDPNKDLKCPFNYFVANLAVADLIVGLIVEPMSIVFHTREGLGLSYPQNAHIVFQMSYFISCTASLLSLAALAIDRYVAITSPLQYRLKLNSNRVGIASVCIWVFSLSFPFIYFQVGFLPYAFVFVNTAVIGTFVVLLLTYVRIFRSLRAQLKIWDDLNESKEENNARKQAIAWERKVTKTFLLMLALFIGCYLPSCVFIYLANLCATCSCVFIHWARDLQFLFVLANSCLNPFLYAWRLVNFRKAFKQLICCSPLRRRQEPEQLQRRTDP